MDRSLILLVIRMLLIADELTSNFATYFTDAGQLHLRLGRSPSSRLFPQRTTSFASPVYVSPLYLRHQQNYADSRMPSSKECVADQFGYAIIKGCLCRLYQSTGLSDGLFRSPPMEFIRKRNISCLIFTFVGDVDELVRVEFTDFAKEEGVYNSSHARCSSYVRIFSRLGRAELKRNDVETERLCDKHFGSTRHVFYSTGRVLIVEAHIAQHARVKLEFKGRYQFEAASWYDSDGILVSDGVCKRLFLSPYLAHSPKMLRHKQSVHRWKLEGQFFSPRFPQNYPANNTCIYVFLGGHHERVILSLSDVQLAGASSVTAGGFKGKFTFFSAQDATPTAVAKALQAGEQIHGSSVDQSEQSYQSENTASVVNIFMETNRRNGIISSPGYPKAYGTNLNVTYLFHIPEDERLKLKFFDLRLGGLSTIRCQQSTRDRILIYDGSPEIENPSMTLCGDHVTNSDSNHLFNEREVISSTRILAVRFITDSETSEQENGFLASYTYIENQRKVEAWKAYSDQYADNYGLENGSRGSTANSTSRNKQITENCRFIIESNGQALKGQIPITQYLKALALQKVENQTSCRWQLQGERWQRIQLQLLRRQAAPDPGSSAWYSKRTTFDTLQHDQETNDEGSVSLSQISKLEETESSIMPIRCQTAVSLELVGYRKSAISAPQPVLKTSKGSLMSWPARQATSEVISAEMDQRWSQLEPSDPIRLCAGALVAASPASKGFMSGSIPRLDIIVHFDMSELRLPQWESRTGHFDLGYDIGYEFVTDYGVTAPNGRQQKPDCIFEFTHSPSTTGNFASPNYPGLYPTDLVCEYRFLGPNVKKIEIIFLEFDVEGSYKTCYDDSMGDYVELSSCQPISSPAYLKRRLCHRTKPDSLYRIDWYEPCLLLRFVSNAMFVRNGFLGVYKFHTYSAGSNILDQKTKRFRLITWGIVLLWTVHYA
ncbi:unnamed protein product [Dicrocoelium dendriticum]|nr:unnamed protein product [Dicrocoelium dendriticum]